MKKLFLILALAGPTCVAVSQTGVNHWEEKNFDNNNLNDSKNGRTVMLNTLDINTDLTINVTNQQNNENISEYIWEYISVNCENPDASNFFDEVNNKPELFVITGNDFFVPEVGFSDTFTVQILATPSKQQGQEVIYKGVEILNITVVNNTKQKNDISILQDEINNSYNKINLIDVNAPTSMKLYQELDILLDSTENRFFKSKNIFTQLYNKNKLNIKFESNQENDFINVQYSVTLSVNNDDTFIGEINIGEVIYSKQKLVNLSEWDIDNQTPIVLKLSNQTSWNSITDEVLKELEKRVYQNEKNYVGKNTDNTPIKNLITTYQSYLNLNWEKSTNDFNQTNYKLTLSGDKTKNMSPFVIDEKEQNNLNIEIQLDWQHNEINNNLDIDFGMYTLSSNWSTNEAINKTISDDIVVNTKNLNPDGNPDQKDFFQYYNTIDINVWQIATDWYNQDLIHQGYTTYTIDLSSLVTTQHAYQKIIDQGASSGGNSYYQYLGFTLRLDKDKILRLDSTVSSNVFEIGAPEATIKVGLTFLDFKLYNVQK